ncbi:hypothetical protein CO683_40395 [Bradyrhizobium ottawaense]|uniref:hypothetical protein n=1 Tax=Bradyrhizobium ottawaense TaxID=931866 RepID=UPI000BE97ECF|nr:hypothetical protein [Bradyrhizobium ottawaense]PDT64094.1 hypothetical protein CO683_40395 [Bradyrhizobium ottawaense]
MAMESRSNAIGAVAAINRANALIEQRIGNLASQDATSIWAAQDELSAAVAKAGIHFEGRAYPLCLRPLVIDAQVASQLKSIVEAFLEVLDVAAELYCCDKEVQNLFSSYNHLQPWIIRLPKHRPIVRICRLDGMFGRDGHYKIIETNTEGPGGVIQTGLAASVWSQIRNPLTHSLSFAPSKQRSANDPNAFVRELKDTYRAEKGSELRSAAVVNFKGRFVNEVDWIIKGLEDAGIEAALFDVRALKRTPRGLIGPDCRRVELVYNKLDVRDMMDADECHAYLESCAAREVVSINPWISQWILSDKAILAVLSDDRFRSNFTSSQIELVARHVPWTRVVRAGITTDPNGKRIDLIDYIRENRADLVLKPSNATRGEGVQLGRRTPSGAWDAYIREAALKPYVVQEHIGSEHVTALDASSRSIQQMAWGIDCYVFGGRLAGFHSRASVDAVMNIGRSGILLPVLRTGNAAASEYA